MKKDKWKLIGIIITIPVIICLICSVAFRDALGDYLSTFTITKYEGSNDIQNYSSDNSQNFELQPGNELLMPVRFDNQLFRIGIYMGEQQTGTDKYVFQLENEYGSILGKNVVGLNKISAGSFVYVNTSRNVINTDDDYFIKIYSDDPGGEIPLNLTVSFSESFNASSFSVNDVESELTLVLDYRYQKPNTKPLIYINLVLIAVCVIYWAVNFLKRLSWGNAKKALIDVFGKIPWKKVSLTVICLLLIANVAVILSPQKVNISQYGNVRQTMFNEQVVPIAEGTVFEQYIETNGGSIDTFALMFATYTQTIQGGTLSVELWDKSIDSPIYSGSVETEKIADNQYHYFVLPEPIDVSEGEYSIRFWADYQNDDHNMAVYTNSNFSDAAFATKDGIAIDGSVIFELDRSTKIIRTDYLIFIDSVLIILLIIYVVKFINFKRQVLKYVPVVFLSAMFFYLPVMSLVSYGELSVDAMASLLQNRDGVTIYKQYDEETLKRSLSVETEYDFAGAPRVTFEQTELAVDGMVSDITLEFDGDALIKKDYDIKVYWDSGDGYSERQSFSYKYIHTGADNVSFFVPCNDVSYKVWINVGFERSSYGIPERILPLSSVRINSLKTANGIFSLKSLAVFGVLVALFSLLLIWKHFEIENKVFKFLSRKKISISLFFVIIATVYGAAMCFFIPTHQTPDEGAHTQMMYDSLRNGSMTSKIYGTLDDQGQQDVMLNPGQIVDFDKYIGSSKNKLDDYSLNYGFPSINILKRPGQTLGIVIGQLLHLPAYWILQLGELGALAVYVAFGAITLKVMPFKKNLMMAVMLLPIAMQQAGSLSYDGFTNAISFLTIAYILHLKYTAEKVGWKQIAKIALLAVALLLGKVIYVVLIGLVLIVPLDKIELKIGKTIINGVWIKNHKKGTILFVICALVTACISLFGVLPILGYGQLFEILIGYISNFGQLLRLFSTTVLTHNRLWLRGSICELGWFDVPVSDIFINFVIISLFVLAFMRHNIRKGSERLTEQFNQYHTMTAFNLVVWYGIFVLLFVTIMMSMVSWGLNMYNIDSTLPYSVSMSLLPRIEGVQGRYFLPIIPLLFIPLRTKKDILKFIPAALYKICYYLIIVIYPLLLLLARYWGIGSIQSLIG